ncbi:MAG: hypothetical protein ACTH31_08915, partial [Pseudoclavibacter sp.]
HVRRRRGAGGRGMSAAWRLAIRRDGHQWYVYARHAYGVELRAPFVSFLTALTATRLLVDGRIEWSWLPEVEVVTPGYRLRREACAA